MTGTWKRFKNRLFKISPKQQELIVILLQKLAVEGEPLIFAYLTKILKRPIDKWENLTSSEVSRAISILKNRQKPIQRDLAEIKKLYSVDEINRIFTGSGQFTEVSDYEGLTHGTALLLLNRKKRFNTIYRDHPIEATMDYEYGWQESPLCHDSKMYYLKFYDLLMIDYDELSYDEVIEILRPYEHDFYFEIHQTFNGYHVFIISRLLNHQSPVASALMRQLKCDHFYILFCHNNGFKIRLSKKIDRDETFIARAIGRYGNQGLLDPDCEKLLGVFLAFLKAEIEK